jgi:photosystem II stability/assembly factor-like uncharacterized protein
MKRLAFSTIVGLLLFLPFGAAHAAGWVRLQHPSLPVAVPILHRISFGDALHGCAIGNATTDDYAAVYTTSDGGASWTRRADLSAFAPRVNGLQMLDATHGWAVASTTGAAPFGMIYSTSDGGAAWDLRLVTPRRVYRLDFPDKDHGFVTGEWGSLFVTTDGGTNWADRSPGQPDWFVEGMDFVDPAHACLVGSDADGTTRARITEDGCATWLPHPGLLDWTPYCVAMREPGHAVVGGSGGIATIDGSIVTNRYLGSAVDGVAFTDARHVFAAGRGLFSSTDGGITWQVETSPVEAWYVGLCFIDERHGWAVGSGQALIAYDAAAPITTASGVDTLWHNRAQTVRLNAVDDPDSSGVAGVASIACAVNGGAPATTSAADASVLIPVDRAHHATDGVNEVSYHATDKVGNVETAKTVSVRIDTRRPETVASACVSARSGTRAVLKYVVNDQAPNGGKASVTIRILTRQRWVVRTLRLGLQRVNRLREATFRCTLPAGRYRYSVYATDLAGNKQTRVGVNTLVVR